MTCSGSGDSRMAEDVVDESCDGTLFSDTSELRCCCTVCHYRENEGCTRQFLSWRTTRIKIAKKRSDCCDSVVAICHCADQRFEAFTEVDVAVVAVVAVVWDTA